MSGSAPLELVVASFDDPIVTGLLAETDAVSRDGAGTVFVVARSRDGLAGCAGLHRSGAGAVAVGPVHVRPEYRDTGVRPLLLAALADLARLRGVPIVRPDARRRTDTLG